MSVRTETESVFLECESGPQAATESPHASNVELSSLANPPIPNSPIHVYSKRNRTQEEEDTHAHLKSIQKTDLNAENSENSQGNLSESIFVKPQVN